MHADIDALIAIPSVSGGEKKIIDYIQRELSGCGLSCQSIHDNLVVYIAGKNNNTAVIFDMHVDTVSPGTVKNWNTDPYMAVHKNKNIYGLGASDEKAGVASAMALARSYAKTPPACDVYFFFVTHEETDGSGTKAVVSWFMEHKKKKYSQVSAILGEPTDMHAIEIAHKGNIFLKVTTYGESGHGSQPDHIKTHAVFAMMEVAKKLDHLEGMWKRIYKDSILGMPTIGMLTSIVAGSEATPNKFPDSCTATFDVRTTPALHTHALLDMTTAIGGSVDVCVVCDPVSCGYTDPNSKIVRITRQVTGGQVGVSAGSTDMCFFSEASIPTVVFGPGTKASMHRPNEYCIEKNIEQCIVCYGEIVVEFAMIH